MMKQKIALILVVCMMISLFTVGTSIAYAEDWKLPKGTQLYKPGRTMALDFGTLTILDAGFAKEAQSIIQGTHVGYYTAKDGQALFAFKGLLYNSSEQPITLESLKPVARFHDGEPVPVYGYPAVAFGIPEYYTLEPEADVEIVFQCTVPSGLYHDSGDILLEFAGGSMGFERADLGNYNSVGFTAQDGESTGDLTEVAAVQEDGIIVANQPHVDEVRGEDVSLEYDSKKDEYRIHVKIRNLTGYPTIHDKLPQRVSVNVQFLDSNGDVLPDGAIRVGSSVDGSLADLSVGQAGWDTTTNKFVSKAVVDKAEWVRFSSYTYHYGAVNSDGSAQSVNGTFTDPLVIAISDILPERKATSNATKKAATHDPLPDYLVSCEAEDFSLRSDIRFGDSIKTVKSKESIPLTGNSGNYKSGMYKGYHYIWSADDKVSGYNGAVGFVFNPSNNLVEMKYNFERTTDQDLQTARYEAVFAGLCRKYGSPLATFLENEKVLKICSSVVSDTGMISAIYSGRTEIDNWEWVVNVSDEYYVKIDLVADRFVTSESVTKYEMRLGYRLFTLDDWYNAINDGQFTQEMVDNDL